MHNQYLGGADQVPGGAQVAHGVSPLEPFCFPCMRELVHTCVRELEVEAWTATPTLTECVGSWSCQVASLGCPEHPLFQPSSAVA